MTKRGSSQWDHLGIVGSALCLVHCLLTPIMVAVLPALSAALSLRPDLADAAVASPDHGHDTFHVLMAAALTAIAILSVMSRIRSARLKGARVALWTVGLVASLGCLCLIAGLLASTESGALATTISGSLLLIGAHTMMLRGSLTESSS